MNEVAARASGVGEVAARASGVGEAARANG